MKQIFLLLLLSFGAIRAMQAMEQPESSKEFTVLLPESPENTRKKTYATCICCHEMIDGIAHNCGTVCGCMIGLAATAAITTLYATGNCPIQ